MTNSNFKKMANITADIYPIFDGYVAKLNLPKEMVKSENQCKTIVILDKSGSMSTNVRRIYNNILPRVFKQLNYSANDKITTLLFDHKLETYEETIDTMKNNSVTSGGSTHMSEAITHLGDMLASMENCNLRLLTISDGMLDDQQKTLELSSVLARKTNGKFNINSQAVRFFTSSLQPDTRGLASMLQLNCHNQIKLIDIDSNLENDVIIAQMTSLFCGDGLNMSSKLKTDHAVIMPNPWSGPTDSVILSIGENILWLNDLPNNFDIENNKININIHDVPIEQLESIIYPKFLQFMDKLRILKVVNTVDAKEEISKMIAYLTKFHQWSESKNVDVIKLLGNNSLRGRIDYFKYLLEKRKKTIFQTMLEIANDDRVGKLNAAQQADYLRTVSLNKNTKALARRALDEGIDFDETVRKEVKQMHQHLAEILNIDDSNHSVSFYSQDTTIGGIKSVCSLVDEGLIDDLSATDILQMINIVGVAANAIIGDYPDAMCWRVEKIFPGCWISVADLTVAHLQSSGKKIYVPGFQDVNGYQITTVIPVFDDLRVANFLKLYAPSILEYVASIGMRRVIATVNMTNCYTVCGGILAMLPELDNNKSTINIQTFINMVKTYDVLIGKYFDHVLNHVKDQNPDLTFYIANNGLTNMISPLYKLIKSNNTQYIDRILRSVYSFESYQILRRIIKKSGVEPREQFITQTLQKLLGIDFDRNGTPVTLVFEPNPKPSHHKSYELDQNFLQNLTKNFNDTNYLALLPSFLSAIDSDDPITKFKSIPVLSDQMVVDVLGLNYDFNSFKLYSVIQSLIYPSKKTRVDDSNNQMLIGDTVNHSHMKRMIKSYICKQYGDDYQRRLLLKTKEERLRVKNMLVDKLVTSETANDFAKLMHSGLSHCEINCQITNDASFGFVDLKDKLFNSKIHVPDRFNKIFALCTAKDSTGTEIWNNSNLLRINVNSMEPIFKEFDELERFEELREIYKKNPTHIYRGGEGSANRHGHSNDKPSFWAYGYQTLEAMINNISDDEWLEYKKEHHNCCGIDQFKI